MGLSTGLAVVAGASGGIGAAISELLIGSGWAVIGLDIAPAPVHLQESALFKEVCVDVADMDALTRAFEKDIPQKGIRAVIYAAGIYDHFPLAEMPSGGLKHIVDVNVMGFANLVSLTFSGILDTKGRYIAVSSETALVPMPFQVYGISKRMLEVYLDSLRQELALVGVPVIAIRPGAHETELLKDSRSKLEEYSDSSSFSPFLDVVKSKGQAVIDRGAADPVAVARTVMKALTDKNPKSAYHVNVALHFRILKMLPDRLVQSIFRRVLGR